MNPFAFKEKLKRVEGQLAEAERLRKEFDEFKRQVATHAATSKQIIAAYLQECQKKYSDDVRQIEKDKQFCQQVFDTDKAVLEHELRGRSNGLPSLAKAFADYLAIRDGMIETHLRYRAPRAADVVKEMRSERRSLAERCKVLEYTLLYYEELFPALKDYRELDSIEEIKDDREETDGDPVRGWLTKEEYDRLPRVEKFQRALDNYWKKPKSRWRLGRDYERYIGHLYEKQGYEVYYQGIIEGLEDCGRDLICEKGEEVIIVQCKYWSRDKVIHEKHINQLFGTCVEYWIRRTKKPSPMELFPDVLKSHQIIPCITTSTTLSDTARQFAAALGVRVEEGRAFASSYPCIKCNVSRVTGDRIYHLPFDQQYDSTLIEKERNECYVETVAEAEARGFRRAFKWHGDGARY